MSCAGRLTAGGVGAAAGEREAPGMSGSGYDVVLFRRVGSAQSSAPPLRWLGTDRGHHEVERAAVAESHRAEIPDVARREPGNAELLGEGDDAGIHEPQL